MCVAEIAYACTVRARLIYQSVSVCECLLDSQTTSLHFQRLLPARENISRARILPTFLLILIVKAVLFETLVSFWIMHLKLRIWREVQDVLEALHQVRPMNMNLDNYIYDFTYNSNLYPLLHFEFHCRFRISAIIKT